MKTAKTLIMSLALALQGGLEPLIAQSQVSPDLTSPLASGSLAASDVTAISRGHDQNIVVETSMVTNGLGQLVTHTNTYTELATGLNYYKDGQWIPSREVIESSPNGAVARQGQHKVSFAGYLPVSGAIDLVTPDGKELRSHVLGLSYFDRTSGQSVLIGEVKTSRGQIVGGNQVIYPDAFTGVKADIRYTYTKAGLEQDVILREQPPRPEDFGLSTKTACLQVLTEFLNPPQPVKEAIKIPNSPVALDDLALDFGTMKMGRGGAFATPRPDGQTAVPVTKQWQRLEGRDVLIESASVADLQNDWKMLPKAAGVSTKPSGDSLLHKVSSHLLLPTAPLPAEPTGQGMALAKLDAKSQGLVLDYTLLTSQTNYTFQGNNTYYLSGPVNINNGIVTFEGGAVIKYTNGASLNITSPSQWNWLATAYRPTVFTAKDDDSVGAKITGSTGVVGPYTYYANPALNLQAYEPQGTFTMDHFRIANAYTAIIASSGNLEVFLRNGQVVNCQTFFVSPGQGEEYFYNLLVANFETAFSLCLANVTGQNITFDGQTQNSTNGYAPSFMLEPYNSPQNGASVRVNLVNCILSHLTGYSPTISLTQFPYALTGTYDGYYNSPTPPSNFTQPLYPTSSNPYSPYQAGNYYLTNTSGFLGAGTTAIDSQLQADLANETTHTPALPPPNNYMGYTTFTNRPIRDNYANNGQGAPDLGYHYDALDYMVTRYSVSGPPIEITNGVSVGMYGTYGFVYAAGDAGLYVQGQAANQMDHLVWYPGVQEQPIKLSNVATVSSSWFSVVNGGQDGSPWIATLSFADLPSQGTTQNLVDQDLAQYWPYLTMSDCTVRGLNFGVVQSCCAQPPYESSAILFNNMFERCSMWFYNGYLNYFTSTFQEPLVLSMGNNDFWSNSITLQYFNAQAQYRNIQWAIANNLFDGTGISISGDGNYTNYFGNSHNGYHNTASGLLASGTDVTLTNLSYATGTLGPWYLGSSAPSLIDAGSESAESAGLATFTTQTNQVEEGCTTVDIGFHYVAVDQNGNPLDNNSDGIPDYEQQSIIISPINNPNLCMNSVWNFSISAFAGCGPLTFSVRQQPSHGTLSPTSGNVGDNITYTPNHNYIGSDSFTINVTDGVINEVVFGTVTVVDFTPSADAQNLTDCVSTPEDITLTGSSQCGEALTGTITVLPTHGSVSPLSGPMPLAVVYTPSNGFSGSDSFTFTTSDGVKTSAPAVVAIGTGPPTANSQSLGTCMNTPLNITLTGNGNCNDPLNAVVISYPTHGTLSQPRSGPAPLQITYTPSHNFIGSDTFYFVVSDSSSSSPAAVSITVSDQTPSASTLAPMTGKGVPVSMTLTGSSGCNEPLTTSITTQPAHGSVSPSSGGNPLNVTYTPNAGFEGVDMFTNTVSDGVSTGSASDTVFVVGGPILTASCQTNAPGILLTWTLDSIVQQLENNNTDGFAIDDYVIYRAPSASGPYTAIETNNDPSVESFIDANVSPGSNYCYIVDFEYTDGNTGITYPLTPPTPGQGPYSASACVTVCQPPIVGPLDCVFILDNTGSVNGSLPSVQDAVDSIVNYLAIASGQNYRLALITPDTDGDQPNGSGHDMVDVRVTFSQNNQAAFVPQVNALFSAGGGGGPESTDECLNTAVNGLLATNRVNDKNCGAICGQQSPTLQIGDFSPIFRTNALRLVVLITDAPPGGFCDCFDPNTDPARVHQFAVEARADCIQINSIQIEDSPGSPDPQAAPIMQDYATTSCGWFTQVPESTDASIEQAILNMIYTAGACSCH